MITINWQKAPSVCGPKKYFLTYLDPTNCRWWITWHFDAQQYEVSNNQSNDKAYFDSQHQAKRWFRNNILPTL
jgi:hypothetical protein